MDRHPERRRRAGLDPDEVRCATKTQLAIAMLERFWAGGRTAGQVIGDEVYGGNPALLSAIASHGRDTSWPSPAAPKDTPLPARSVSTR